MMKDTALSSTLSLTSTSVWRAWLSAFRPKTLTAAIVPILAATAVVKFQGVSVQWLLSLYAVISALLIQIGTNLINDALDFKTGADTEERLGPQRATQMGWLTGRQVMTGGIICLLLAVLSGIPLVLAGGWVIVVIGLLSLLCAYAYTGGPYPLAYRGMGDLFVIIFFGWVAVGGVYYLHAGTYHLDVFIAGTQVGLLATVLIAINNLRDIVQDQKVNKRTLAVRFGVRFVRTEIVFLTTLTFFMNIYWIYRGAWLAGLLPLLAYPIARRVMVGVLQNEPGPCYNKFLAEAGLLHLLFGLQLTIGLMLQ